MSPNSKLIKALLATIIATPIMILAARKLPAAFTAPPTVTSVEINGVNFGEFGSISGLSQFDDDGLPTPDSNIYARVKLERDFVTSPSLYLWAKNRRSKKNQLQDIQLVTKDLEGNILGRKTLEFVQPLSWTVEATNPSLGGFNEKIELAVQKLSIE